MKEIIKIVADFYGIPDMLIYSSIRKHDIAFARHVSIYFLKEIKGMKLVEIGRLLERNHSTIQHSTSAIYDQLKVDKKLQEDIKIMKRKIDKIHVPVIKMCKKCINWDIKELPKQQIKF